MSIEKVFLLIGAFAYFVIDIITTAIGLHMGATEMNPFIQNLSYMVFAKIGVLILVSIILYMFVRVETNSNDRTMKITAKVMRRFVIVLLLILGLGVGLFNNGAVIIAYASFSNGTHSVSGYELNKSYTPVADGGAGTASWAWIQVANASYNTLDMVEIRTDAIAAITYAKTAASTPFTVDDGCSNLPVDGYFSYDATRKSIKYTFTNTCIVNNQTVHVIMSNASVPLDIQYAASNWQYSSSSPLGASFPVGIRHTSGGNTYIAGYGGISFKYFASIASTGTANYEIQYTGSNFNANITKTGSVVTRVFLNHTTNTIPYISQSSADINPVGYFGAYQDGLWLNLCLSNNVCNPLLVNSTNIPDAPGKAGTNMTNVTKPTTGVNIGFDKSAYYVGDNVNVSWYFSDSKWDEIGFKYMRLYLNGVGLSIPIDISQQTGYYIYQATETGTLEAEIRESIILYDAAINSASVQILPPGNSWIALTNTTGFVKVPLNVTYHIGFSVASYPAGAIAIYVIDDMTNNLADAVVLDTFPDYNATIGQIHPLAEGNYTVKLFDATKDSYLDQKKLKIVRKPEAIPTAGILVPSISADKAAYFYNDWMQINFVIDDVNYSNFSIRGEIYDINNTLVTKRFYSPFSEQVGTFNTVVNIDKNTKCEGGLNCWFNTGNNTVRMIAYNSTVSSIIAYYNFSVSTTTTDGYGLLLSTTTPTKGVPFQVTTIVPTAHTATLKIADSGYASNFSFNPTKVSAGTSTFPVTINRVSAVGVGYYDVMLYGDDGIMKVKIPITVSLGTDTALTEGERDTTAIIDGWVNLFNLGVNDVTKFLFATMFIIAFTFIGFWAAGKNLYGGVILGFIPYAFFTYIEYVPRWFVVVIALIVAIKMRWFN